MLKKGLLFTVIAAGFVASAYFYGDRSYQKTLENWYARGKKAVGF